MSSPRKRAAIRKAEQAVQSAKLETGGERFSNALLKAEVFAANKRIAELTEQRDELLALVKRYRKETPLGHQPHMIAHLADEAIAKAEK